jgi:hypothetical protein
MCTGLWKRGVVDNSLYRKFVCNHPSFPLKGAVPRDWIQRERAMLERREASARSVGTLASPRVLSESNHTHQVSWHRAEPSCPVKIQS